MFTNSRCLTLTIATLSLTLGSAVAHAEFPEYQNQDSAKTFMHSAIMTNEARQVEVNGQKRWVSSGMVDDRKFAKMVKGAIAGGINEIAFAFNQCNGGGMIDELLEVHPIASFMSAARHDQLSRAGSEDPASGTDPLFDDIRRVEGTYNLHYAPAVGQRMTQYDAAEHGYNRDIQGPTLYLETVKKYPHLDLFRLNPQYASVGGVLGNHIVLRETNIYNVPGATAYRAILFGGSTIHDPGCVLAVNPTPKPHIPAGCPWRRRDPWGYVPAVLGANWNTLNRMHDALLKLGYKEDEMYIMAPYYIDPETGKKQRVNPADEDLPAWVDGDTTAAELQKAWDWLGREVTPTTQVFFWSSWGHGTAAFDWLEWLLNHGQRILDGIPLSVPQPPDFSQRLKEIFDYYNSLGAAGAPGLPFFEVVTSEPIASQPIAGPERTEPGLEIFLNRGTEPLRFVSQWLDPFGEYHYQFALSGQDVEAFLASETQSVVLNVPDLNEGDELPFILEMGPTLGALPGGLLMGSSEPALRVPVLDAEPTLE